MTDEQNTASSASPRPPRKYTETGEPDNKGLLVVLGIICLIVFGAFAYFMIFHFHDTFFEKVVVTSNG